MNQTPKISVMVCCYNVAKWLKMGRLNDVYNQTYNDWELLLIDDGSTDETPMLLDAEAAKDARVKVFHKKNGGLGDARNYGLDKATGEYIVGFDIDDNIEPDMLEYCVNEMDRRQVDVMMYGLFVEDVLFDTKEVVQLQETEIKNQDELRKYYLDRILLVPNGNGFFCNKCYRMSFLNRYHLRFADQRIQQDEYFNLKVYEHLERCYISTRILYHYYIYSSGNNRSRFLPNRFDIYKSIYDQFRHILQLWSLKDERFEFYINERFYENIFDCLRYNLLHDDCLWSLREKRVELHRIVTDKYVCSTMKFMRARELNIENRLYLHAFMSESLFQIRALNYLFGNLRTIKNKINNLVSHK